MENKECPICECSPEGTSSRYAIRCTLCNVAITDPGAAPTVRAEGDRLLYFCCGRCRDIYVREAKDANECMEALKPGDNRLANYDDAVKDMVIEYISRKYPKGVDARASPHDDPVDDTKVRTHAVLTCPECGASYDVEMPVSACQVSYICPMCGTVIRAKKGDCCVFCSYADTKCPPEQLADLEGGERDGD